MKLGGTRWIAAGAGAGLLALVLAGPGSLAQDATPVTEAGDAGEPHPAHIHVGTCANLDPTPLFPLADIVIPAAGAEDGMATPGADEGMASPVTDMASPVTGTDMATPVGGDVGVAGDAIPAGQSTTVVESGLNAILAADHAINVHLSYDEVSTYIACGNIDGSPDENGNLFIGIAEQNDSGYSGIAWLHDQGDGTTTVTVFLAMGLHDEDMAAADGDATPST